MKTINNINIDSDKIKNIVAKVCAKHRGFHNFRAWELGSNIVDNKPVFKIQSEK